MFHHGTDPDHPKHKTLEGIPVARKKLELSHCYTDFESWLVMKYFVSTVSEGHELDERQRKNLDYFWPKRADGAKDVKVKVLITT